MRENEEFARSGGSKKADPVVFRPPDLLHLPRKNASSYAGLLNKIAGKNLNLCALNTLTQKLLVVPEFQKLGQDKWHSQFCSDDCALSLWEEVVHKMLTCPNAEYCLLDFAKKLATLGVGYELYKQWDASEFLLWIFKAYDRDVCNLRFGKSNADYRRFVTNAFENFESEISQVSKCISCGSNSRIKTKTRLLTCTLDGDVHNIFRNLSETVVGYACQECRVPTTAIIQTDVTKGAETIFVKFGRTQLHCPQKATHRVSVQNPVLLGIDYEPFAWANHYGIYITGGHYDACVRPKKTTVRISDKDFFEGPAEIKENDKVCLAFLRPISCDAYDGTTESDESEHEVPAPEAPVLDLTDGKVEFDLAMKRINARATAPRSAELEQFYDLCTANSPRARFFRKHTVEFQNMCSFASLVHKGSKKAFRKKEQKKNPLPGASKWNPTINISGKVHHYLSSGFVPGRGNPREFLQIYFDNDTNTAENRAARMKAKINTLKKSKHTLPIVEIIMNCMKKENPFLGLFERAKRELDLDPEKKLVLHHKKVARNLHDPRIYKLGKSDCVAALVEGDFATDKHFDIVLRSKAGKCSTGSAKLTTINEEHWAYDSLFYTLMHMRGDRLGHQRGTKVSAKRNLTLAMYWRNLFMPRPHVLNLGPCLGRLWQTYICDTACRNEQMNLNFLRTNTFKKKRRSAFWFKLKKHGPENASKLGRVEYLPSSVKGSAPVQRFHDSTALARVKGGADLFLTVTMNSAWPWIQKWMKDCPPDCKLDRPEILARAFHDVLQNLIEDIKGGALGKLSYFVGSVEWQMRGLPHVHLLIKLMEQDVPKTAPQIDSLISAEIPKLTEKTKVYRERVEKHVIHQLCGNDRPPWVVRDKCYDSKTGKCKSKYKKPFCIKTTRQTGCYAKHQRRSPKPRSNPTMPPIPEVASVEFEAVSEEDWGEEYQKRLWKPNSKKEFVDVWIDNRSVVPHSPYLLVKYDCHHNLEHDVHHGLQVHLQICVQGANQKQFRSGEQKERRDRQTPGRSTHVLGRSCVAAHGLSSFFLLVEILPIHLPGKHRVIWEDDNQASAAERLKKSTSKLLEWFKLNIKPTPTKPNPSYETAKDLFYYQIPGKFSWTGKFWKLRDQKRKHGKEVIGPS